MENRIIQLIDSEDYDNILLANTNMTEKQINEALFEIEVYDEDNLDYEQKCERYAEENNLLFERLYVDEEIYV
jgi:hypothetical protein